MNRDANDRVTELIKDAGDTLTRAAKICELHGDDHGSGQIEAFRRSLMGIRTRVFLRNFEVPRPLPVEVPTDLAMEESR